MLFPSSPALSVQYFDRLSVVFFHPPTAIAIYKPPDVRPILQAYHGKDVPIEYAKKEAEAKQKHIEEWERSRKGLSQGGFTLSSLFGGSDVRAMSPFNPPVNLYMLTIICLIYFCPHIRLGSFQLSKK